MEIKADPARLMMSEALKGAVPQLENDEVLGDEFVVTAEGWMKDGSIAGALRSVLFDPKPEIEFRVLLDAAFDVVEAQGLVFTRFTIQRQDRAIELQGPFTVKAARISEIDADVNPDTQMCVLALSLQRDKKA